MGETSEDIFKHLPASDALAASAEAA